MVNPQGQCLQRSAKSRRFGCERGRPAWIVRNDLNCGLLDSHRRWTRCLPNQQWTDRRIIDIQVSVATLQPLSAYGAKLEAIGYVHVPHPDDSFFPFFHRPIQRTHSHHVHVVQRGGREERRTLAFRDYLRDHLEVAREYEDLKRAIAGQVRAADSESRERYALAKTAFIERVVALAVETGYPQGLSDRQAAEHARGADGPDRLCNDVAEARD